MAFPAYQQPGGVIPHHQSNPQYQPNPNFYAYEAPKEPEPVNTYPDAMDIDMDQYSYMPKFQETRPEQQQVVQPPPMPEYGGTLPQPHPMEHILTQERPTSPLLLYNAADGQTYGMPVRQVALETELHVETAFTRMTVTFVNTSGAKVDGLFVLPTPATITSCDVNLSDTSYLGTTYISAEKAAKFAKKKGKAQEDNPIDQFIPDVFRLPIANIQPGDVISIEVDMMETLRFVEGRYHLEIPLRFGQGILPETPVQNVIQIKASINSLTPGMIYGSSSHQLIMTGMQNLRTELQAVPLPNHHLSADFHLAYRCQTNMITAALIHEGPERSSDNRGAFVCFVNPPAEISHIVPRDIIFLIDRSGSMHGPPFESAAKGLSFALDTLQPHDRFGIVAFDHERVFFNPMGADLTEPSINPLAPADPHTVGSAKEFIFRNGPRGATDIRTPISWALESLSQGAETRNRIPFIVLLTDGAVRDEKEICRVAKERAGPVRILTFGIGQHCNWYFLKVLSLSSRGWNEGSLYEEDLFPKMRSLIERASAPVMTNVEINIPGVHKLDLYPETVPDLFVGGPITLSGKYSGHFPPSVEIRGISHGQFISFQVRTDTSQVVSVNRVFLKQRMDQLTAQQWLTDSAELKKEMVDLSVEERFPSRYTSMVAYQMTPEERRARDGADGKKPVTASKGRGLSAKQVAGLAGGAIVVGAGLVVLGSVAATMSGGSGIAPLIGGGLGGMDLGFDAGGCCDGLGECLSCGGGLEFGSCLECGACADCGDIFGNCGCFEGVFGACAGCGDIFSDCGCIEGACGACGELSGICSCGFADLCGQCGDLLGPVLGFLGSAFNGCGEVLSVLGDCL